MLVPSPVRRCHWPLSGAMILITLIAVTTGQVRGGNMESGEEETPTALWVYVGTYTHGKTPSQGIYLLELDLASGSLTARGAGPNLPDPSFLAIHPSRKFLYAVNELGEFNGRKGGGVSALAIDPASGKLTLLNQQSSVGSGPCHLTVDSAGKNVLVANYGSGSVACLPIQARRHAECGLVVHPARRQERRRLAAGGPPCPLDQP